MGRATRVRYLWRFHATERRSMSQPNNSNKSVIPLEQDGTMIAVIEMGQASWLVGSYRIQVCGAMICAEWRAPLGP